MKLQPQSYPRVFWPFPPFFAIVQEEVSPRCLQSWAVKVKVQKLKPPFLDLRLCTIQMALTAHFSIDRPNLLRNE